MKKILVSCAWKWAALFCFLANVIGPCIWSRLTVIRPTTWLTSCHIKAKVIAMGRENSVSEDGASSRKKAYAISDFLQMSSGFRIDFYFKQTPLCALSSIGLLFELTFGHTNCIYVHINTPIEIIHMIVCT